MHDAQVISLELARQLRDAGLAWQPGNGDAFVVDQPAMAADVFVLSDMVVVVHEHSTGPVIRFNGTTEWAMDSVQQYETVWLPSEEQLRALLGPSFAMLRRTLDGWQVTLRDESRHEAGSAADAYGLALLAQLSGRSG